MGSGVKHGQETGLRASAALASVATLTETNVDSLRVIVPSVQGAPSRH